MEEFDLGPNGAMIYCMDFLEQNFDWLVEKLEPLQGGVRADRTGSSAPTDLPWQIDIS